MSWLAQAVEIGHAALLALDDGSEPRRYLTSRGVTEADILAHRLGYWSAPPTLDACTPEGWHWLLRFGYDRLVFPLTDPFGVPIGVQVRHLGTKGYENFVLKPRELYIPLFGLHHALPHMYAQERVVLVEGVFDYFATSRYAPDTLCTLTANVTNSVRRLIARYCTTVVCLFDMDQAGRRGAYKLAGLPVPAQWAQPKDITFKAKVLPPYRVLLPLYTAHDPADLFVAGKTTELQRLVR